MEQNKSIKKNLKNTKFSTIARPKNLIIRKIVCMNSKDNFLTSKMSMKDFYENYKINQILDQTRSNLYSKMIVR